MRIGANGSVGMARRSVRHVDMELEGKYVLKRMRHGDDYPYRVDEIPNAVTTAGRTMLIKAILGQALTSPEQHLTMENTMLRLQVSQQQDRTFECISLQTPGTPVNLRWEFQDISADVYSVQTVQLLTTQELVFSQATAAFSGGNNKPSDENWLYEYHLTLTSSDPDLVPLGLHALMRSLTEPSIPPWNRANTRLQPQTSAQANVGNAIQPDVNFPDWVYGSNAITWQFTSADGQNNGAWDRTRIYHTTTPNGTLRDGPARQNGTGAGTKAPGEEWVYTFTLTITT